MKLGDLSNCIGQDAFTNPRGSLQVETGLTWCFDTVDKKSTDPIYWRLAKNAGFELDVIKFFGGVAEEFLFVSNGVYFEKTILNIKSLLDLNRLATVCSRDHGEVR